MARLILVLLMVGMTVGACAQGGTMGYVVDSIPSGYHLYAYDDCGVDGRQPHVDMADCYFFTFSNSDMKGNLRARSAVFSYKEIRINYDDLDPKLSYYLAMTYGTDQVYKRVQSLEADGIELHRPIPLPNGKATKVIVKVPASVTEDGKMALKIKIHGEVNATVSIIELWASAPPAQTMRIGPIAALPEGLAGRITSLAYDGIGGAEVRLVHPSDSRTLATAKTQPDGSFAFARSSFEDVTPREDLEIVASQEGQEMKTKVAVADQLFEPVRYRPIPAKVAGLESNVVSLDGVWSIDPDPAEGAKDKPLSAKNWKSFQVPGQWPEQGFDIPRDKHAAMAREFAIPKEWAGYRIFLRFNAIHAGTHYWLNGKPLGYSENLFTPVEWEITDSAKPGQTNRLDLDMVVQTASERLSCSSDYTGHSIGGIDRAVRIYALPKLQISSLHLNAGLDKAYKDGELELDLGLDNPAASAQSGVSIDVKLYDAKGKLVEHSVPKTAVKPGDSTVIIRSIVPNPLKWNAEQPNLYKLVIELKQSGKSLERIERNIGFRSVEIKNRQLYVNGVRVKLAGVCHHEIDPLTGRANTARHAEDDVKFYKSANLNYVRTSHYPCTQEFLDAADKYGLYIESEAPFCWVGRADDLTDVKEVLTPTSAMVDYNHSHPSVVIWSLANESTWSGLFEESNKLVKRLDPTRPTTIEEARPVEAPVTCDITNRHYQKMPYDIYKDDPRPFLHGECFFLVYHERTDVRIDPGLRELWAMGSADPTSDRGKKIMQNRLNGGFLCGIEPGAWSFIYASKRVIGSEIWSGVDDISYLPDGKVESSEAGNAYWGLIDGWRRPKPELYLSKFVFSPVWFPVRQLDYGPGQSTAVVPVENRYSFTDLDTCAFAWELNGEKGQTSIKLAPGSKGQLEVPVPTGTPVGSDLLLRVTKSGGEIVNAILTLGKRKQAVLPKPHAGAPKWSDDGKKISIEGKGFSLVIDKAKGDFDAANPKHTSPIKSFPALHVTRHDYGDLKRDAPPYAVFPDAKTRVIDGVTVAEKPEGLEIAIKDHYKDFAGAVTWLVDKNGVGDISYDYTYTGDDLETREIGLAVLLRPDCDTLKWKRWSEWGVFPKDCMLRTEGVARAHRDKKWPAQPLNVKPTWPWSQDETELGTTDFRSIKFNIYQASLTAPSGVGIRVDADADAHVRACLDPPSSPLSNGGDEGGSVRLHLLTQCPLAPEVLRKGDKLAGRFVVELLNR